MKFSYSIVLADKGDTEGNLQLLSLINEIFLNEEKDAKNLINLLYSLGNLLYNNVDNRSIAKDMDIQSNLKQINPSGEQEDILIIKEVNNLMLNLLK
jgi:hypothetical protein